MRRPLLGCIADDFTGATDMASNLVEAGMHTIQFLGIPGASELPEPADAVVIALKSRAVERDEAVRVSIESLRALQALGCRRFYFKYCSTFDSTDEGNIGPVAEALLDQLDVKQTIFCPSFPENGRTVYQGHLFVGDRLLNESGMQHHPLNPMTDANLVRVLTRQARRPVGLVPYHIVERGMLVIQAALQTLASEDKGLVVVDSLNDEHLQHLAHACGDMPLLTGGSGLASALPAAYRASGLWTGEPSEPGLPKIEGRTAILSGSCSIATQQQVDWMGKLCPSYRLTVQQCLAGLGPEVEEVIRWSREQDPSTPIMIYSTAGTDDVAANVSNFGRETAARTFEEIFARLAVKLVDDCHVTRLVVAGGETSGAVVSRLGIQALRIGPRIAPGVPWTESLGMRKLALALKSGNFGTPKFFQTAVEMLP